MTAFPIDASTAERIGPVSEVVAPTELSQRVSRRRDVDPGGLWGRVRPEQGLGHRAGVATGVHVVPGVWHGFSAFVPWLPLARRATDRWIEAMGEALDRDDRGRAEGRSNAQSG